MSRGLFAKSKSADKNESLEDKEIKETVEKDKRVQCCRTKGVYLERRAKSEVALEQELDWHMEKGYSYHCISFGDVDSLTYLRMIVKQQRIEYCLLSTWCMAITDVKEIELWLEKGYIKRMDFYVGEIFQGSYSDVYLYIKEMVQRTDGRVCIFRNHSKVMAGMGERFDFVIESSANVNTNPRCEQTAITIDSSLAYFYKNFFDEIQNFSTDFSNWIPYEFKMKDNENNLQ